MLSRVKHRGLPGILHASIKYPYNDEERIVFLYSDPAQPFVLSESTMPKAIRGLSKSFRKQRTERELKI